MRYPVQCPFLVSLVKAMTSTSSIDPSTPRHRSVSWLMSTPTVPTSGGRPSSASKVGQDKNAVSSVRRSLSSPFKDCDVPRHCGTAWTPLGSEQGGRRPIEEMTLPPFLLRMQHSGANYVVLPGQLPKSFLYAKGGYIYNKARGGGNESMVCDRVTSIGKQILTSDLTLPCMS